MSSQSKTNITEQPYTTFQREFSSSSPVNPSQSIKTLAISKKDQYYPAPPASALSGSSVNALNLNKNLAMNGKVRTRERCPKCNQKYRIIEEIDIICDKCGTRPKTFFIFLYWHRKKYRISRNRDGCIFTSYQEAHRLLEKMRADIDSHIFYINDYLSEKIEQFRGQMLLQKWLEIKESQKLSPTHLREVRRYVSKYFAPFFGHKDCRNLRTYDIEDFISSLPKHLSIKTNVNILHMLKNFCKWLLGREILLRMPTFPKLTPPETPIRWITKEKQLKIIDAMDPYHKPLFLFMAYHPLRPGEVRALKIKHLDLENRIIHVCTAFSLNELRSRKGKKPYYLPLSETFDKSILKNKLSEAYVFLNKHGRPYSSEGIRKLWKRACKKAGELYLNPYNCMRHSIASQAINRGIDIATVSKALGHSSLQMTLKYASLNVEMVRQVVDGTQVVHIKDGISINSLKR